MTRDTDRPPGADLLGLRPETLALLGCLDRGEGPDEGTAQGFGLLTPAHVRAVRRAYRRGEVSPAELDAAWRDGTELGRLIGSAPSNRLTALAFWVPPGDIATDTAAAAFAALGERHRRFSGSAAGEWLSSLAHADRASLLEEELAAWAEALGLSVTVPARGRREVCRERRS